MSEAGVADRWVDATGAAALFAVDPAGLGGVVLRARPGPTRDRWLGLLRALLPADAPVRRVPLQIADGRLLGGLDLTATLQAGRPIAERGILAEADGGVILLAMAERLSPATAARLAAVMDAGAVLLERDGLAQRTTTRFGVVALDEGVEDDDRVPDALHDRMAFHLYLEGLRTEDTASALATEPRPADEFGDMREAVQAARERLAGVTAPEPVVGTLCSAALSLGIASIRAPLLALRAARASAALEGRTEVSDDDVVIAARLVLAPRARQLPTSQEQAPDDAPPDNPEPPSESEQQDGADEQQVDPDAVLEDMVLAAAQAAIPPALLAQLRLAQAARARSQAQGRAGAEQQAGTRGRPAGVRRGDLRSGRLNVLETLRAAAPWQRLRRATRPRSRHAAQPHIQVRREDFRITRYKQRTGTTTIFIVDASGSSALHRLAEAKGAVELLLAESYVRRDRVALVAFRGKAAELLLPPTRSLVRAKRSLAELPGGGGTPLAAAIDAAGELAEAIRRKGETPVIVLLTDGRANVARDGTQGRAQAEEDALASARALRAAGITALLVDTSPRAQPHAERIAQAMQARYLPLPYADAKVLSQAVKGAAAP
jgi:magnesium chelatase subunit D